MNKKHVYCNGYDSIIATSIKEAMQIHIEYTEYDDQNEVDWYQIPDDKLITIGYEDMAESLPEKGTQKYCHGNWFPFEVTATAKAWCDFADDPFLCSTEY